MLAFPTLLLVPFVALSALAADHKVTVGAGGLKFNPSSVNAAAGDTVTFSFSGTHTATVSSFATPCEANTVNAFSAFPPNDAVFDVTGTNATWFFCSVGNHCSSGMVFAINPAPDGQEQSFANYQAAAMGKSTSSGSSSSAAASASSSTGSSSRASAASPSSSASTSGTGSSAGFLALGAPTSKGLFVAGFIGGTVAVLCGLGAGL